MLQRTTATRYHDISAGHRVHGHESKCAYMHGHNYRVHFTCHADAGLDAVGRVLDFSAMKSKLCMWLEDNWDHKFLAWAEDPIMQAIAGRVAQRPQLSHALVQDALPMFHDSIVWAPFNPTAENMAEYLVKVVGPKQLAGTGVVLTRVVVDETRKCSAAFEL